MTARRLLHVAEAMLVEEHGRAAVDEFLAPVAARRDPDLAHLAIVAMDGEVA